MYVNANKGILPIYWRNPPSATGFTDMRPDGSSWAPQMAKLLNVDWSQQVVLDANFEYAGRGPNPSYVWICPSDPDQFEVEYVPNYPNLVTYQWVNMWWSLADPDQQDQEFIAGNGFRRRLPGSPGRWRFRPCTRTAF